MSPVLTLILALMITLTIEVPLGALIIKRKSAVIPLVLINILTNPALNAVLMLLFSLTQSYTLYWIAVVIGEIAVFIGEGVLLRALCNLTIKRAFIISTITNMVSLFLGSVIMALI